MGGSRPWTRGRAASLAAVVVVTIGVLTGLSHIGHSTLTTCNGTWWTVVGNPGDRASTSTDNQLAVDLVATPCTGWARDGKGGFLAIAIFSSQADASTYANALVAAGFERSRQFTPYVRQQPASQPASTQ